MASDANSPWAHLVQDTAGMANQTTSTPFPSGIQVTLPNSRFLCPQDHCKMEKTAPPVQTTSQFILIKNSHFGQPRYRCHRPTTPSDSSPPGYCLHFNSCGNCSRAHQDTSNQARALPHTTQNSPRSYIAGSEAITVSPPSTNNFK